MSLEAAIIQNTETMERLIAVWNKLAETTNARPVASGTIAADAKVEVKKSDVKPAAGQPTATEKTEAAAPESTTSAQNPAAQSAAAESQVSTAATTTTYDQVAKAINEGAKADRAKVVAALAKFGAKKGTELDPGQYAQFLAELA
jgi:Tfp pilus assembly protein PilE